MARKKSNKVPQKYLAGYSKSEKEKRKKEIARNKSKAADDPSAYKFATNKKNGVQRKTVESRYTRRYREMYT
jgi:hypothetical protein